MYNIISDADYCVFATHEEGNSDASAHSDIIYQPSFIPKIIPLLIWMLFVKFALLMCKNTHGPADKNIREKYLKSGTLTQRETWDIIFKT